MVTTGAHAAGPGAGTGVAAGAAPRPGRPRSPEADRAIVDAALELVADGGVGAFCVEGVAARAGVSKTTIYRRFPSKEALLAEALGTLNDDLPPTPDTGGVRGDLVLMLRSWSETYEGSHKARMMPRMMSAARTHPELYRTYYEQVVEPRRERFRQALRRGIERGEVRDEVDLELAVSSIIGPMMLMLMSHVGGVGQPRATPEQIVDLALGGLAR